MLMALSLYIIVSRFQEEVSRKGSLAEAKMLQHVQSLLRPATR